MKENLAKLFYDFAKIMFATGVVSPVIQKFDLKVMMVSFVMMVTFIIVAVVLDVKKEDDNGNRN